MTVRSIAALRALRNVSTERLTAASLLKRVGRVTISL